MFGKIKNEVGLVRDVSGAGLTEYGLLAALIAAVSIAAVTGLGTENRDLFSRITSTIETPATTGGGGSGGGGSGGGSVNPPAASAPTNVVLSRSVYRFPRVTGNEFIGILSAIDPDVGDSHTFQIVAVRDASLNPVTGAFLVGDALWFGALSDTNTSDPRDDGDPLTVTVRATDSTGLTFDRDLVIDAAFAPTNILLNGTTAPAVYTGPATLGTLTAVDADIGDSHTFEILLAINSETGEGINGFSIAGNQLVAGLLLEDSGEDVRDIGAIMAVTIRATDSFGFTFTRSFTISAQF